MESKTTLSHGQKKQKKQKQIYINDWIAHWLIEASGRVQAAILRFSSNRGHH